MGNCRCQIIPVIDNPPQEGTIEDHKGEWVNMVMANDGKAYYGINRHLSEMLAKKHYDNIYNDEFDHMVFLGDVRVAKVDIAADFQIPITG